MYKKKNIFTRIKGIFQFDDTFFDDDDTFNNLENNTTQQKHFLEEEIDVFKVQTPIDQEEMEGELSIDLYENNESIFIQSMVAGVKPESLDIVITRDVVLIKGKREDSRKINDDQFFTKELYWGSFSRSIDLPQEIDPDLVEATEKYGLLTLKLPKIDRSKQTTIKIKSL